MPDGNYDVSRSPVFSFTVPATGTILPAPTLLEPPDAGSVTSTTVTFRWSPVPDSVRYQLCIYYSWSFNVKPICHWASGTQTTEAVTWVWDAFVYRWSVAAVNDYALGTYAPYDTFRIELPAQKTR